MGERFELNDNSGEAPVEQLPPRVATNTIYSDMNHPSALAPPVVYLDDHSTEGDAR